MSKSKKKPGAADKQPSVLTEPEAHKLLASLDAELALARIDLGSLRSKDEWVHLSLRSVTDLDRFLQIVTKVEPGKTSVYRRIIGHDLGRVMASSDPLEISWRFDLYPVNAGHAENQVRLAYRVGVDIPSYDLAEVLKRVRDDHRIWQVMAGDRSHGR